MHERRWTGAAAIVAAAMLGFALWQHVMPPQFVSTLGLNPGATAELHAALHLWPPAVSLKAFTAVFRALLVVAFAGYGLLLWFTFRSPPADGPRRLARAALAFPVVVALLMPADLSADVYTYVGYARMAVVHGLNPHVDRASELLRLGDPTAPFIHWKTPSPYGPLASLMTMAAVAVAPAGSLLLPVMLIKLMTAAALVAAAVVTGAIVRELDPARADAARVATALNPLLLIEGPGSAHNDIITVAFVLLAFLALVRRRPWLAAVAVGAGAAVKLIPLLLLPWIAFVAAWPGLDEATGASKKPSLIARLKAAAIVVGLGMLPVAILYVPFWRGTRTFASLGARWQAGHTDQGGGAPIYLWLVLGLYLLGSALLLRARRASVPAAVQTMIVVWAALTLPLLPLATDKWFPWYLTWAWSAALVGWNRVHAALFVWLLPISLILTLVYSVG
jgi:hypothetical protein